MEITKQASVTPKKSKPALGLIFFIMLMDIIGLSILVPVAPYIVKRYSGDALMVTMLTVIYAGALFFAAPLLGKISDRIGRRPVLLVSVMGSAVGYFIFGIGGALWVLFLSRLIDGITGGNLSTAAAYIADVSSPTGTRQELHLDRNGVWPGLHPRPRTGRRIGADQRQCTGFRGRGGFAAQCTADLLHAA